MSDESIKLIITRQGLEAAISAKEQGVKLKLKWVSAGDLAYTPSKEQTALKNELARAEFGEFKDLDGPMMQCAAKFSGPEEYPIRELGFWHDDGTEKGLLFGIVSKPDTTLNYKAKNGHCIQPFTLNLSEVPSDSVTVVVGAENLNILVEQEFAQMAKSQVDTMHLALKQEFRLLELENAMS